jgi:hypothetical protein
MKLDVDSRKREESSDQDLEWSTSIPWDFSGNFTSDLRGTGRRIEIRGDIVLRDNTTEDCCGKGKESVQCRDSQYRSKWESASRSVSECYRVHPHKDCNYWGREQTSGKNKASHPVLSIHLSVESNRRKSSHEGSQTI